MAIFKVENELGQVLNLSELNTGYQVINVNGLNPPKAQINTSKVSGLDGSKFNSSTLDIRNIVITIALSGNVEQNRLLLYQYFISKSKCKLYYQNNSLDVYIEGYVESVECNFFTDKETMQISIICTNPYFKGIEAIVTDLSKQSKLFEFPFSLSSVGGSFGEISGSGIKNIINNTESETGLLIDVEFTKNASKLKIINVSYGETFTINYNFLAGDKVTINTNKGEKAITLRRNNTDYNLFPSMEKGSTFFPLRMGDNVFTYSVNNGLDDDAIYINFKYNEMYKGV